MNTYDFCLRIKKNKNNCQTQSLSLIALDLVVFDCAVARTRAKKPSIARIITVEFNGELTSNFLWRCGNLNLNRILILITILTTIHDVCLCCATERLLLIHFD